MKALSIFIVGVAILLDAAVTFAAQSASGAWSSKFPTPPSANAPVEAFATIGTNLYVGGPFTEIAGVHARHLAKFDGQNWSEVGGGISGDDWVNVKALCTDGTNLYVGGFFTRVGGLSATNIAKWTGDHWDSLGNGATIPGFRQYDSRVETLCAVGTNVFAGGRFDIVGGVSATNIVRWDGAQWHPLAEGINFQRPADPNQMPYNGHVSALATDGTNLYVGGHFASAGSVQTTNLARWDGLQWQPMLAALDEGLMGMGDPVIWDNVKSLAWHKNALYVGGDFQVVAAQPGIGLAKWDGSNWTVPVLIESDQYRAVVKSVLRVGDKLYVAGDFDRVNGQPSPNAFFIQDDTVTTMNCPIYMNPYGGIFALGASGERVFFGGEFTSRDFVSAANFVEFTSAALKPLTFGLGNDVPHFSRALASDGTNIFVAGDYGRVGTNRPLTVAKWDGTKWSAAAPSLNEGMTINHIAVVGSNVFVAGNFKSTNFGVANLARWDGLTWRPLGTPTTYNVDSMLALGSRLYVAGGFSDTGASCKWWDGSGWMRVPWSVEAQGAQRLATDGPNLYIARPSRETTGVVIKVARWDGFSLFQLPDNIRIPVVSAIAAAGSEIWVAGSRSADWYSSHNDVLFRWTDAGWSEWSNVVDAGADIRVMTSVGSNIIAAGFFKTFAGFVANSIALWDGISWRPMDGGVTSLDFQGSVASLAVSGNRLALTGYFDMAGRTSSGNVAVWTPASNIQFNPSVAASGAFQVSGAIGDHVEIEASDSLLNWTKIAELQFLSPTQQFTDPASPNSPKRFYRAKVVEP